MVISSVKKKMFATIMFYLVKRRKEAFEFKCLNFMTNCSCIINKYPLSFIYWKVIHIDSLLDFVLRQVLMITCVHVWITFFFVISHDLFTNYLNGISVLKKLNWGRGLQAIICALFCCDAVCHTVYKWSCPVQRFAVTSLCHTTGI